MNDQLDAFVDNSQTRVFDEARRALGEDGRHRWQIPGSMERMDPDDASAVVTGSCGDTMEIYLQAAIRQCRSRVLP